MGDVGAVAELIAVVFKWATNPTGYAEMSLDRKLETLQDAANKALAGHDWAAVDQLVAEYKRLSASLV